CVDLRSSLMTTTSFLFICFSFMDPPPTEIYTLSLHDALPISPSPNSSAWSGRRPCRACTTPRRTRACSPPSGIAPPTGASCVSRSEEHTSELQSRGHLVCRLLLEKKKTNNNCASSAGRAYAGR